MTRRERFVAVKHPLRWFAGIRYTVPKWVDWLAMRVARALRRRGEL